MLLFQWCVVVVVVSEMPCVVVSVVLDVVVSVVPYVVVSEVPFVVVSVILYVVVSEVPCVVVSVVLYVVVSGVPCSPSVPWRQHRCGRPLNRTIQINWLNGLIQEGLLFDDNIYREHC